MFSKEFSRYIYGVSNPIKDKKVDNDKKEPAKPMLYLVLKCSLPSK